MPAPRHRFWRLITIALAISVALPSLASAQLLRREGLGSRLKNLRERASGENSAIHYDPAILAPGVPRQRVIAAFGEPNATQGTGATRVDVYAFKPDGAKFVDPHISPATIAAAVFTGGMSLAVRRARIKIQESKLTLYKVHYDAQDRIKSVQVVSPKSSSGAPAPAP